MSARALLEIENLSTHYVSAQGTRVVRAVDDVSLRIEAGSAIDPRTRPEARAALLRAKALSPDDPRVKANLEELDAVEKNDRRAREGSAGAK